MFKPKFDLTNKIAAALTAIERARGFLEAATLSEIWIKAMQNRALILEAHHTTHIEGTELTLEQSEQLLAGKNLENADPDDVRELLNYKGAFALVAEYLGHGDPVTEGLIREIHKHLVSGVRGNSAAPGEYRKIQNYVVNSQTKQVIYSPPAAYEVPSMMANLVSWINKEREINAVLISGISQFQFVHIHPFLDGNGRTARLLSTLCLYQRGYDFKQLFAISEYYDRNRTDYYRAIQSVRENDMNMTGWLEYFCDGLATQLQEVKERGARAIKNDVIAKQHHLSVRQASAVDYVLERGSLSIQEYENMCSDVTRRTLQRELRDLVDKGVFEVSGATTNLLYKLKF